MLTLAVAWATLSALATALGTLVLAVATFAAVRSSNKSARVSEAALQEQRRPVLTQSRHQDADQKLMFVDRHWVHAAGGQGTAEHVDGVIYLSLSLRNVGAGIAVCQRWHVRPQSDAVRTSAGHAPLEEFRTQTRDLYVPPTDIGMWQGAIRDQDDPAFATLAAAIDAREAVSVELLYTDLNGGQRTITRFGLFAGDDVWHISMNRLWYLDWDGPRSHEEVAAANQQMPIADSNRPQGD